MVNEKRNEGGNGLSVIHEATSIFIYPHYFTQSHNLPYLPPDAGILLRGIPGLNDNGSNFPFIITAKEKHSVQSKKPGYHPARLHNGKSRGFLIPLLKDKVSLHPNGGEILNGRAHR